MSKYTEEMVIKICNQYNIKYIDGYINTMQPFNCICACGEEWSTHLHTIMRGYKCLNCSKRNKYSQEVIEEELESYGLVLLSEYNGNRVPMTYICECGGIGKTKLCHIRNGSRCGHCNEMHIRDRLEELGYKVLQYIKSTNVTILCKCGNIETIDTSNFFKNHIGCSRCKTHWNYKPNSIRIKRQDLRLWKKEILARDNFKCQRCGSDDCLHVHHIEAYSTNPELVDDVNNGIVLCDICHKGLHSKYGFNVGLENLIKELQGYKYHE